MPRLHLRPITDYTSSARYMPTLCGQRVSILDTTTRTDRADCPDCLGAYAVANAPTPPRLTLAQEAARPFAERRRKADIAREAMAGGYDDDNFPTAPETTADEKAEFDAWVDQMAAQFGEDALGRLDGGR